MTARCRGCGRETDEPIAVGLAHSVSGPGSVVMVCSVCLRLVGLVPLDEHPPGGRGYLMFEKGAD